MLSALNTPLQTGAEGSRQKYEMQVSSVIPSLEISVSLLHRNVIQNSRAQILRLACEYNSLIEHIGSWILTNIVQSNYKQMVYLLDFEEHYVLKDHIPKTQILIDLVNQYLRRSTSGYLFGIGSYHISDKNKLHCVVVPNELWLLDQEYLSREEGEEASFFTFAYNFVKAAEAELPKSYGKLNTIYYDPSVFQPSHVEKWCAELKGRVKTWAPSLHVLTAVESSSQYCLTILLYQNQNDFELQHYLFNNNYDEIILAVLQARGAEQSFIENIFNFKITHQMLQFLSLLFLLKYQLNIWLFSLETSVYINKIQFADATEKQLNKLYRLKHDIAEQLSEQQVAQFRAQCGDDVSFQIEASEDTSQQIGSATVVPTEPTDEITPALVQETISGLISQYNQSQDFKRLQLSIAEQQQSVVSTHREEIVSALNAALISGDNLIVQTDEYDQLSFEVLRGSAVQRRNRRQLSQ